MSARRREGQPSALAVSINLADDDTACAFVDQVFPSDGWYPPLMKYRLESTFQDDWKAELGNTLLFAQQNGFLDPLVAILKKQANKPGFAADSPRSMNDRGHLKFHREVAPATVAYYLSGTGWSFERWEPEELTGDVDLLMRSPTSESVAIQVKGSGRYAGSEDEVLVAIGHARDQLQVRQPTLIAICAQTALHLAFHPRKLLSALFGRTVQQYGGAVVLHREDRGHFFTEAWRNIGGILLLDFVRAVDRSEQTYASTVLINPMASRSSRCQPEWFAYSRVLALEGDRFRWHNGEPDDRTIPTGTILLE